MTKHKTLRLEVSDNLAVGAKPASPSLGNDPADTHDPTVTEEPGPDTVAPVGAMVQSLLMDPALNYEAIVARVMLAHPTARTTVRSVASTASVMRKRGATVPERARRGA